MTNDSNVRAGNFEVMASACGDTCERFKNEVECNRIEMTRSANITKSKSFSGLKEQYMAVFKQIK